MSANCFEKYNNNDFCDSNDRTKKVETITLYCGFKNNHKLTKNAVINDLDNLVYAENSDMLLKLTKGYYQYKNSVNECDITIPYSEIYTDLNKTHSSATATTTTTTDNGYSGYNTNLEDIDNINQYAEIDIDDINVEEELNKLSAKQKIFKYPNSNVTF
jgi:hypothetical protein